MTEGSPQRPGAEAFLTPGQVNQRRYEALRAFFVDELTYEQAGERFGYTRWAMVNLVREHRAGKLELFAAPKKPGPPAGSAPAKDRARGRGTPCERDTNRRPASLRGRSRRSRRPAAARCVDRPGSRGGYSL